MYQKRVLNKISDRNLIVLLEFRQNDLEQCADWNLIGQCVNREIGICEKCSWRNSCWWEEKSHQV